MSQKNESKIKYSIIIPCGGFHHLLDVVYARLIKNVGGHPDIEIIFVDNCLDTKLANWLKDKKDLISVREHRKGPSCARNAGAAKARGDFLIFQDDDVFMHPQWIKAIENLYKSKPWITAISGSLRPAPLKNKLLYEFRKRLHLRLSDNKGNYLFGAQVFPVMNSSLFAIRKNVFLGMGGFCEVLHHLEDNEFTTRLLRYGYHIYALSSFQGEVFYLPDNLWSYIKRRFHKGLWLGPAQGLTGYWNTVPVSEDFPNIKWKGTGKYYLLMLDMVHLVGYSIGLAWPKLHNPFQLKFQVNFKASLIFQFIHDGQVFQMAPYIGIVWLDESLSYYRYGFFKRSFDDKEKIALEKLFQDSSSVPDRYKQRWMNDRLFVEKPRLPSLALP